MKPLVPYLFFNGNCRDALGFYKRCFGGELQVMTYGDAPEDACAGGVAPSAKDKVMHGRLSDGAFSLMASDNPMGGPVMGDNVHLTIECETIPQIQELFKALGDGGEIKMPLADTFWGAHFGMLIDKFGVHWMLNCPLKS